jgi:hypothetical protein
MKRKKFQTYIVKKFEVFDEKDDEKSIFESSEASDVAKHLGLSVPYIYTLTRNGKYVETKVGNVKVEYWKVKKTIELPFLIREDKRETIVDLPGEVWRQIPNMPDCNWASDKGRFKVKDVFGNEMSNTISLSRNNYGKRQYRDVMLENPDGNNIRARAPRVLAHTFISNNFPIFTRKGAGIVVDHIDNNSLNDDITNLRILTHKENLHAARYQQASTGYRIPNKPVECVETGVVYPSAAEASRQLGFSYPLAIAHAANPNQGQQTAAGYHWRYTTRKPNIKAKNIKGEK